MNQQCARQTGRDYLQARLSPAHETLFLQHLDVCPRCRAWLEDDAGGQEACSDVHQALAGSGTSIIIPPLSSHNTARPEVTLAAAHTPPQSDWQQSDWPQSDWDLSHEVSDSQHTSERHRALEIARSILGPTDRPDALGRIGNYEVLGVVGQGGMGIVFKALDPPLNRIVAIKVIDPLLAKVGAARQRFAREARAMASVAHENVVPIHAVSEHRGLPFFVMEYVPGQSLEQRLLAQGPLTAIETVRIGLQTAQALAAAHRQGLIHRDIKPGNLLLQAGVDRVLVTDFGLARVVDDANMTQSGLLAGTPQYMAPEHVTGSPSDPRSDLFSLGCVMYAMWCGHSPFRAETVYQVMQRIVHDVPRPLREHNPAVPAWLEGLIFKLLAKSPADRFSSAHEVVEVLAAELAHLQNPAGVQRPERSWWQQPQEPAVELPRSFAAALAPWFQGTSWRSAIVATLGVSGFVLALSILVIPSAWWAPAPTAGQVEPPSAANAQGQRSGARRAPGFSASTPLPANANRPGLNQARSAGPDATVDSAQKKAPNTPAIPAEWSQLWHSDDGLGVVQHQLQAWESELSGELDVPGLDAWSTTAQRLREQMVALEHEWEREVSPAGDDSASHANLERVDSSTSPGNGEGPGNRKSPGNGTSTGHPESSDNTHNGDPTP